MAKKTKRKTHAISKSNGLSSLPKRFINQLPGVIIGLVAGGLVAILCFYKFSTSEIILHVPFPSKTKNQKPLPTEKHYVAPKKTQDIKNKTKFEFYHKLTNSNHQESLTKENVVGARYVVKAGTYFDSNKVRAVQAELTLKGYPAEIKREGSIYRIIVGPFTNLQAAYEQQKLLEREQKIFDALVVEQMS